MISLLFACLQAATSLFALSNPEPGSAPSIHKIAAQSAPRATTASPSGGKSAASSGAVAIPSSSSTGQGGKISFAGLSDGVTHVYIMNANGAHVTQLTSGPHNDRSPEWSADGTKLVFGREEDGFAIYTMNADGSGQKRLSSSPGRDLLPYWSPDGKEIAFTHVIDTPTAATGAQPATSIMIMNADGTNARTLVSPTSSIFFNMEPHFSPDGSKIAYMCGPHNGGMQICVMNADGSGVTRLTDLAATSADPHWSQDGKKIAFSSNRGGGNVNLYVMNPDGGDVTKLTQFAEPQEAGDAGWSLDDSEIAFEWDDGGHDQSLAGAPAQIWIMNANGSGAHTTGVSCSGAGCAPRFQPGSGQ